MGAVGRPGGLSVDAEFEVADVIGRDRDRTVVVVAVGDIRALDRKSVV